MTSPQKENGYTPIANELMEALAGIRISGEARQCLDVILRKTYGFNKKEDQISLSQFVLLTKMPKATVCRALLKLANMSIIIIKNDNGISNSYRLNKDYSSWKPLTKKTIVDKNDNGRYQKRQSSLTKKGHTKETITKDTITKEILQPKVAKEITPFKQLKEDKNRHIQIIGLYWEYLGIKFDNYEQQQAQLRRNLKGAKDLIGYTDEQILNTMRNLDKITNFGKKNFKWTIETILKYISE